MSQEWHPAPVAADFGPPWFTTSGFSLWPEYQRAESLEEIGVLFAADES